MLQVIVPVSEKERCSVLVCDYQGVLEIQEEGVKPVAG